MAEPGSMQQLNIEHFNKHSHEAKPHMLALADATAQHICSRLQLHQATAALEFGCGNGLISERLAPLVGTMHGVDIAPNMVAAYNAKAASKGLGNMMATCLDVKNTADVQAAIDRGDLPANFDIILCHMVLHHVENAAVVVQSLGQLLKPGGKLVLTDLHATGRSKGFHGIKHHHTVSHPGGFSEDEIRQLVQGAGLGMQLECFDTTSLLVTKMVEQPNGRETSEDFPVFVAIASR